MRTQDICACRVCGPGIVQVLSSSLRLEKTSSAVSCIDVFFSDPCQVNRVSWMSIVSSSVLSTASQTPGQSYLPQQPPSPRHAEPAGHAKFRSIQLRGEFQCRACGQRTLGRRDSSGHRRARQPREPQGRRVEQTIRFLADRASVRTQGRNHRGGHK